MTRTTTSDTHQCARHASGRYGELGEVSPDDESEENSTARSVHAYRCIHPKPPAGKRDATMQWVAVAKDMPWPWLACHLLARQPGKKDAAFFGIHMWLPFIGRNSVRLSPSGSSSPTRSRSKCARVLRERMTLHRACISCIHALVAI